MTERLRKLINREHTSLQDLARLMSEYHTVWQGQHLIPKIKYGPIPLQILAFSTSWLRTHEPITIFLRRSSSESGLTVSFACLPKIHADTYSEMCTAVRQSQFAIGSVPPDVLDTLHASKPEPICERAWLVIFYSVALSSLNGTASSAHSARLRSNLWLAFNDVRLLLEPSFLNIQALVTMTLYAEKYLAPHACWELISKACAMLIALGVGESIKIYITHA